MFHTLITLAYIIPNIYVFLRIWFLFIPKGFKLHYLIIYLLFAAIYPLSNLFHDAGPGTASGIIVLIANYILPFYLYLFLSVLAFDIFLLLNLLLKIIPREKLKSSGFRKFAFPVIILLSLLPVIAGIINFTTIRTSEYRIEVPRKSARIDHLRIAFAADFHLKEGVGVHFVERFVKKISDIDPDILLYGGDIVEGDRRNETMTVFENLLGGIKTKYGVYGVLGNHEYYAGQDKGNFFNLAGITILNDTIIVIDSSFNLGGRFDSHFRGRKTIDALMSSAVDSLPVILLDHRPTDIENVSRTAADIQLSGHTHDGQLFPINLITGNIYILSHDYKKTGNTNFFVTSGIRLWGPPVRTVGKSEIMVIDVKFNQK
jgi:uncharacterized protein